MSVCFETLGVIVGRAEDVETVHAMILQAEGNERSDRFKYRRFRANGTQVIAYEGGCSDHRPQLEIMLQRKDVGLDSLDVCVLVEGRAEDLQSYAVCHYRGREISADRDSARKSFALFCAGRGLEIFRVLSLASWS